MSTASQTLLIYRSSNGDRWYLVEGPGTGERQVRHQPNRASGGQSACVALGEFLDEGHGPQHEALLRLLEAQKAGPS